MIGPPVACIERVVTLAGRHSSISALFFALACTSPQADGGGGNGAGGLPSGGAAGSQVAGNGPAGTAGSVVGTGGSGAAAGAGATAGSGAGAGVGASGAGAGGAGSGGAMGSGGSGARPCNLTTWPTAVGATEDLSETLMVSGVMDGGMKRYRGVGALGTSGQGEDQPALMRLADGATLQNVIIGAPAADGIHCDGNCTLYNVWWEDVGEDAATLDGESSTQTMTIECAGARQAEDKVFQHNGPGTMILRHITVDDFSKVYRSCGNCLEQYERHVILDDITARNGSTIVGINENYGDTADFSNIVIYPAPRGTDVCVLYQGNDTGAEPSIVGDGPDPTHCRYEESDIDER
jgi:pectate lyase